MLEKRMNIAEAKKRLSEIVGRVAYAKEKVLLMKRGIPMAEIVPLSHAQKHPADVRGWLETHDVFFKTLESLKKYVPRVVKKKRDVRP